MRIPEGDAHHLEAHTGLFGLEEVVAMRRSDEPASLGNCNTSPRAPSPLSRESITS